MRVFGKGLDAAEIARTLAASTTPATVEVPGAGPVSGVRHGAADDGRLLLLCRWDDPLLAALPGDRDVSVQIPEQPPLPFSPTWGELRVTGGRARPLAGGAARVAAEAIAGTLPEPDLLDVGRGTTVLAVAPVHVTLTGRSHDLPVDLADYRGAEPDPIAPVEQSLLVDLVDQHGPQLYPFLWAQLTAGGIPVPPVACPARCA